MRPQLYRQLREIGKRKVIFPKKVNTNLLSSAKQSSLKPYIQVTLYGLYRLYRNMHIYANTYTHHTKVILKGGHEFEGEKGEVIWEDLEGGKGWEKYCNYNLKFSLRRQNVEHEFLPV